MVRPGENLPGIITAGRLLSDSAVTPTTDVAFDSVKELRRHKLVAPDHGYPMAMASEHVPLYIRHEDEKNPSAISMRILQTCR